MSKEVVGRSTFARKEGSRLAQTGEAFRVAAEKAGTAACKSARVVQRTLKAPEYSAADLGLTFRGHGDDVVERGDVSTPAAWGLLPLGLGILSGSILWAGLSGGTTIVLHGLFPPIALASITLACFLPTVRSWQNFSARSRL